MSHAESNCRGHLRTDSMCIIICRCGVSDKGVNPSGEVLMKSYWRPRAQRRSLIGVKQDRFSIYDDKIKFSEVEAESFAFRAHFAWHACCFTSNCVMAFYNTIVPKTPHAIFPIS